MSKKLKWKSSKISENIDLTPSFDAPIRMKPKISAETKLKRTLTGKIKVPAGYKGKIRTIDKRHAQVIVHKYFTTAGNKVQRTIEIKKRKEDTFGVLQHNPKLVEVGSPEDIAMDKWLQEAHNKGAFNVVEKRERIAPVKGISTLKVTSDREKWIKKQLSDIQEGNKTATKFGQAAIKTPTYAQLEIAHAKLRERSMQEKATKRLKAPRRIILKREPVEQQKGRVIGMINRAKRQLGEKEIPNPYKKSGRPTDIARVQRVVPGLSNKKAKQVLAKILKFKNAPADKYAGLHQDLHKVIYETGSGLTEFSTFPYKKAPK